MEALKRWESEEVLEALKRAESLDHVQIGLVDMLKEEYGIEPAGMLGHSAGEITCGYADGCLTREQTVLIAYHRGDPAFLPAFCSPSQSAADALDCVRGPE